MHLCYPEIRGFFIRLKITFILHLSSFLILHRPSFIISPICPIMSRMMDSPAVKPKSKSPKAAKPFRAAILRGLGVVAPPLLTVVIFPIVWQTVNEYVLKPVTGSWPNYSSTNWPTCARLADHRSGQ